MRIQGNLISLAKPLIAPLTQRECSAYTFRFSEKVQRVNARSKTEEAWQTSKYVETSKPFLIECEDALALIRTDESKVIVHVDKVHDESTYMKDSGGFLTKEENENRALALQGFDERLWLQKLAFFLCPLYYLRCVHVLHRHQLLYMSNTVR